MSMPITADHGRSRTTRLQDGMSKCAFGCNLLVMTVRVQGAIGRSGVEMPQLVTIVPE